MTQAPKPGQPDADALQEQADRDDVLEDTFPASDPPATGGSTGPGDFKGE